MSLPKSMLISLSVDKILLPICINWSTNFRSLLFNEETAQSSLKHLYELTWRLILLAACSRICYRDSAWACVFTIRYPSKTNWYLSEVILVLIFNFHFLVVYLICFDMWLRVLISRKIAIYSDGDNIIIIIIIGFLGLSWFCVGCVGISLVDIPSLNVDGK